MIMWVKMISILELHARNTKSMTYVSNIKLVSWVVGVVLAKEVVRSRTRRRSGMEALTCHSHANLTWDRGCSKSRFVFTVLKRKHS